MKAVVIGCGRVGSRDARKSCSEGWDVTVIDEKEEALARLGADWAGGFVVGHGMDIEVLAARRHRGRRRRRRRDGRRQHQHRRRPGRAEALRRSTASSSGCSTPRAPTFYATRGMRTVCPTQTAISALTEAVRACTCPRRRLA